MAILNKPVNPCFALDFFSSDNVFSLILPRFMG